MYNLKFWQATAERAVKTFAEVLLAIFGTSTAGVLEADLAASLQVAGAATLLSVLVSVVSANIGKSAGPSLVGETIEDPEPVVITVEVPAKPALTAPKKTAAKKTTTATPKKPTTK